jgi:hypothetical protein
MSKKYTITDLQGTCWWEDTFTKPLSRAKIRNRFKGYPEYEDLVENEHITNKDFTLDFIQDMWGCEIKKAGK